MKIILRMLVVLSLISPAFAEQPATVGWRGNWTGRFPEAAPPTTWSVKPRSPVVGLRYQAGKPSKDDAGTNAKEVWAGDVAAWLELTGFNGKDAASALDEAFLPEEAAVEPGEGDKAGGQEWKLLSLPDYRDGFTPEGIKKHRYGPYALGWIVRFFSLEGKGDNTVGYAHTYLHAQSAGKVCIVVNHEDGMKAWVNGKEAYRNDKASRNFYNYEVDASIRDLTTPPPCPRFEVELNKGWNRLLVKLSRKKDSGQFTVRIAAPADTKYETSNVRWMTAMPSWSWSTPIVVGDRIFVTSEPDELVCVSRRDGKILWRRPSTLFDATPESERAKNPAFKEIEPLAAELAKGVDADRGMQLRRQITDLLKKIDKEKYDWTEYSHISAIGHACATPCSDGKFVYAFFAPGVVVCYDIDGNRKWIQNVLDLGVANSKDGKPHKPTPNCSSPALVGDKLILFKGWFRAFDKNTGKVAWDTGNISKDFDMSHGGIPRYYSSQSLVGFNLDGTDLVMGFWGRTLRVSDGKVMSEPLTTELIYTTPVITGDTAWVWGAQKFKMTLKEGKVEMKGLGGIHGTQQWTLSSPLLHDGLVYVLNNHGELYVSEAETLKPVYNQRLEMWPLFHFNAIGATPSIALGGKHIYLMDNQGTTVVIEPGRSFKQVAYNRVDTALQHAWPLSTRERTEGSPVFDGKDMFVRGERFLYCIGTQ